MSEIVGQEIELQPGAVIEGQFDRVEIDQRNGYDQPWLVLAGEDALWRFRLRGPVILRELGRLRPVAGELVRVERSNESRETARGTRFFPDTVSCPQRQARTIGWDDPRFAEEDAGPPAPDGDDPAPF